MSDAAMGDAAGAIPVFVNARPVRVAPGAAALAAVRALDPGLAGRVEGGEAYLTDGRAVPLDPSAPLAPGAIVRVVVSARRVAAPAADAATGDADAHA